MNITKFLKSVAGLRFLAITVCTLTNLYFVSIFWQPADSTTAQALSETQWIVAALMLLLYLLLRNALSALTRAKAEDLDELQLKMRDDAYRLGYLVVRRVGLGVLIATAIASPILNAIVFGGQSAQNADIYNQTQNLRNALKTWFQGPHLFDFGYHLMLVLVFTAYCFEMVVLAWRNARFQSKLSKEDLEAMRTS